MLRTKEIVETMVITGIGQVNWNGLLFGNAYCAELEFYRIEMWRIFVDVDMESLCDFDVVRFDGADTEDLERDDKI